MESKLCQDWLDRVADFIFVGNREAWMDSFSLPLEILSDSESSTIFTVEGLSDKFDAWSHLFAAYGVTQMARSVREVISAQDGRIVARYDTDLLAGGKRIMPRFSSIMVLVRQGNHWRCSELITGLGAADRYLIHETQPHTMRAAE